MILPQQIHPDKIARVTIHFAIRRASNPQRWRIACWPDLEAIDENMNIGLKLRTEDPRAVSCLNCLHTTEHAQAMAACNAGRQR